MENRELNKIVCSLIKEIAKREKKTAIKTDDYGIAFVAAIVEGISKEAEASLG